MVKESSSICKTTITNHVLLQLNNSSPSRLSTLLGLLTSITAGQLMNSLDRGASIIREGKRETTSYQKINVKKIPDSKDSNRLRPIRKKCSLERMIFLLSDSYVFTAYYYQSLHKPSVGTWLRPVDIQIAGGLG